MSLHKLMPVVVRQSVCRGGALLTSSAKPEAAGQKDAGLSKMSRRRCTATARTTCRVRKPGLGSFKNPGT